jgi:hypothetical protein
MLINKYRSFVSEQSHIHVDKESDRGYKLHADMVFMTEQFSQFQITVIEETLWQIQELIEDEDVLFDDIVRSFENILQDTNEKLILFADKMTSIPSFDIRWIITLSQHTNFVSVVLWDTSIVLVRKWHIAYTMQNDHDTRQKISLFSDIIEWDIQRDDVLFFFGVHVDALLDRDDMEHIVQKAWASHHEELLQAWVDDIGTRVPLHEVWIVSEYYLNPNEPRSGAKKFSVPVPQSIRSLGDRMRQIGWVTLFRLQEKLKNRQFILLLSGIGLFLIFVLWSIIHWFIKNYSSASINVDWSTTAQLSIEDIKKEIFVFQKLDPTSDEKSTKYNVLIKELNRIQLEWKRANDVQQLKKILNAEYLQWFNIITLDDLTEQMIYGLSSLESSTLQKPLSLFFHKWLYIAGTQWAILGWISTDIKWTSVRNASSDDFTTCSLNLLKNWMYCATSKGIYHLSKAWAETIWWENITFPWSVVWLATFGSSNFYVLTTDSTYTQNNAYVGRFTNVLWSQSVFGAALQLPLVLAEWSNTNQYTQWFSSIAIDWSFLVWSKDKKALVQLYRNPQDKALSNREVPLKWWTSLWEWFSDDVKVMTSVGTRYVYLYDRKNHTLTVYLSAPAKTTDTYATSYSLEYVMRLDLSALNNKPVDVTVDESDGKQSAYILVDAWVAKVPMSDLLDTLKKTRQVKAQ